MVTIRHLRDTIDQFALSIRGFVQEELGCGCPEQVFEQIRILKGDATPDQTDMSLVIGERLLVSFARIEVIRPLEEKAPGLIQSGVIYRDAVKLNRLRLVIQGVPTETEKRLLESESAKYEKVHIHFFP